MTKAEELCQFLAWVQDSCMEIGDDLFWRVDWDTDIPFTREEIVQQYLSKSRPLVDEEGEDGHNR